MLDQHITARRFRLSRNLWKWLVPTLVLIVGAALAYGHEVRHERMRDRLLANLPDDIASQPDLIAFGVREATPLYAQHCASCHSADMSGNTMLGAPNLTDSVWLYGEGRIYEIERTLLYGIRSGHSKSHNVTDMPAFGQRGRLTEAEIRSLVQYLLKLSGRPYQVEAANEGQRLYTGDANCGDCHAGDARGDTYYGAPSLTVNVWNNGGDPEDIFKSIYFGQHRSMPAWIDTLSLVQIRALAVLVYAKSREPKSAASATVAEAKR
jgi:cytochrome c oxidase cbb3-type subunit 3